MKFRDRIKRAFTNIFKDVETQNRTERPLYLSGGGSYGSVRPDRRWSPRAKGTDIITSIYNRIAVDAANVKIQHVVLDEEGRFSKVANSGLNDCLTFEANIDQGGRAFRQDIFQTILEEGNAVILPVDVSEEESDILTVNIETMRVGTPVQWYPRHILVNAYDDREREGGRYRELYLSKEFVAPIENPFYAVMNDNMGTLKRLVRKIGLLDAVDEIIGSGQLDLIIQLPYVVKTETKRNVAEERRAALEAQLSSGGMGVGYLDATERITQLNRPVENSLLKNVEYLTNMLYTQLGITEAVLNGTAGEEEMTHYQVRIIKPLLDAVVEGLSRKYLTKEARKNHHAIKYYQDPLALMPPSKFAQLSDVLSRNAILSSNEVRDHLGRPPVDDELANELINRNMPYDSQISTPPEEEGYEDEYEEP